MKISVVGTGYVGLVTGVCFAHLGHSVTCIDVDQSKIDTLNDGRSPLYEPGLDDLLSEGINSGRLVFTTDIGSSASSEVIFIAVGTPPRADGSPDLDQVSDVARAVGRAIGEGHDEAIRVVVNKSTVPVGSAQMVAALLLEGQTERATASAGTFSSSDDTETSAAHPRFVVASNPEFLRQGSAIMDTLYPDRIIVGATDERAFSALRDVYSAIQGQHFTVPVGVAGRPEGLVSVPIVETDPASAEMIKYTANAFLATKISFANEIANICERVGADINEVMHGVGLDKRIGHRFLNAGVGWGGSCLGKDISALIRMADDQKYEPELLNAAAAVNGRQRDLVVRKLESALGDLAGKKIGMLGLAFKPDTDDLRDAPSVAIAAALSARGAVVRAYDPVANEACMRRHPELEIAYCASAHEAVQDCDAVVLVTEWDEFSRLDLASVKGLMRGDVFVDGRNMFDAEAIARSGLRWYGVGR